MLRVVLWQIGVVCVVVKGNQWTTYFFIFLLPTPFGCLRHSLDHARLGGGIVVLLAILAWESYFEYLEFDSRLLDVDCMLGTDLPPF